MNKIMFLHHYIVHYYNYGDVETSVITDKTWEEYQSYCVNKLTWIDTEEISE
jgi:hypothetical protein